MEAAELGDIDCAAGSMKGQSMSDDKNTLSDYENMSVEEAKERAKKLSSIFPKCAHTFEGWREFEDGNGGEQVCTKCGIGAMAASLRKGP